MKKTKKFITILLILLFASILVMMPLLLNETTPIAVRSIDGDISELSIDEKVEKFKEKFNDIETTTVGNVSNFSASLNFNRIELSNTEYDGEKVTSNYDAEINYAEETFKIKSELIVNDSVIETVESDYVTIYQEEPEKFYLVDNAGNKIDIVDEVEQNNVEECFALTLSTGIAALIAALAALVIVPPVIVETLPVITDTIEQLFDTAIEGAMSFWDNMKLAFGGITAIALPNAIELTEGLAEKSYKRVKNSDNCYLLCGPVIGESPIMIQYKLTDIRNAANWIKKGGSIWSPSTGTAKSAIKIAGYLAGDSNGILNRYEQSISKATVTFKHYPALNRFNKKKVSNVHSLFGIPTYKERS